MSTPNEQRASSVGFERKEFFGAIDSISQWAMGYMDSLGERDVTADISPGDTLSKLPLTPPVQGMCGDRVHGDPKAADWDAVTQDVRSIVEPGLMHWQSSRFFAYFPCGSSMPGVMGELVSAVLNVNGMLWSTSPSATELEMRMMDWCATLFGLPDVFRFETDGDDGSKRGRRGGGCIQGTASEAVLTALVAARKRQVSRGRDRGSMTLYTSTQAHSSVVKAAMVAGLADGPEDFSRVRLIPVDEHLAMDADALEKAIAADIESGLTPCLVSTTQGTTSTGAYDPLVEVGRMLENLPESDRPWLHVDAAWAGAASVCPEHRGVLEGVERADSLCINPHKWLLTNFDCDLFWVRDRQALTDSMSITPAYLRDAGSESGEVIDYRDWHVPLGRRLRAMKLWFVIRYFGAEGLMGHIRHHVGLAEVFEGYVRDEERLVLSFERSLGLVCFHVIGDDERTKELIERINASRRVMISHTVVPVRGDDGEIAQRWVARVAIGASGVEQKDIDELIHEINKALDEVIK